MFDKEELDGGMASLWIRSPHCWLGRYPLPSWMKRVCTKLGGFLCPPLSLQPSFERLSHPPPALASFFIPGCEGRCFVCLPWCLLFHRLCFCVTCQRGPRALHVPDSRLVASCLLERAAPLCFPSLTLEAPALLGTRGRRQNSTKGPRALLSGP